MKPLLRVVLIADALLLLAFGVLFLLTPWSSLYDALQLVQPQPELVGQLLGLGLVALAWLAVRAAIDGALTAAVGKVIGHVNWLAGVLVLVWTIGVHAPRLTGFGQLIAGVLGVGLIVLGLGGVRLAGAVRRRDREQAVVAVADAPRRPVPPFAARREPVGVDTTAQVERPVIVPREPVVAPVVTPAGPASVPPVARGPASDAGPMLSSAPGAAVPGMTPPGLQSARNAARDEAAGAPRPPLHG